MKSFKVKYFWFKLIKTYEVSALDNNSALKEFERLMGKYPIHKVLLV